MKSKGQNTGARREVKKPAAAKPAYRPDPQGLDAAARVAAAGGRVPAKFLKAAAARPAAAGPTLVALAAQSKLSPARRVAFEVLLLVEQGKGHADDLLRGPRMEHLSEPDRHLATALVMGVLRWQIALDAQIRKLLERPDQRLAPAVALALRLGAFQLQHMDRIPAHAALSESVELCRAANQPHATGMVNAVLRKVAALPAAGEKVFETPAAFAERLGHPAWLVERWAANFGRAAALQICEADQEERLSAGLFLPEDKLPDIDDGSRLIAEIAARAVPEVAGRAASVWDCCAAPGGKTLVLAARLSGARILATDKNAKRLLAAQGRFRRFPYAASIQTAVADACDLSAERGNFDLILCDVPCSGTGTLARNPEIRLRLQPADLKRQAERQVQIVTAALTRLAPGGRLVYSTCSLEPEENEQVIAALGERVRRLPVERFLPALLADNPVQLEGGALRTLPGVNPCDGFYATVLELT